MNQIKFIAILIISIITFESCKNDAYNQIPTENFIEKYGSGETSRVFTRKNGKIEGKMTDFYRNGALKGERYFENDQQIGKTIIYYESGKIKEVQYYANGLKNGGDTIFYESGAIQFVSDFKDEKKNGYLRKWDEDGMLTYEAKFAMDTLIEVNGEKIKSNINTN